MQKRSLFILAVMLAVWLTCYGTQKIVTAQNQNTAPNAVDATFTTQDGKTVKLSDYRGKRTVILLFMRGFTGDFSCYQCSNQTRAYKEKYEELTKAGAEVLAILPGATDAAGFLKHIGLNDECNPDPSFNAPFPVVLDTDFAACKIFDVPFNPLAGKAFPVSQPATIVIAKDGTVLYAYHGKTPPDRPKVDDVLGVLRGKQAVATPDTALPVKPVTTSSIAWMSYDDGLKAAKSKNLPILIDFYADW